MNRLKAQKKFNEWFENKENIVLLDTETTGLYGAEIVEIAVTNLNDQVLFESLVNPVQPIPTEATVIHGITNEMVKDAPSWPEVWDKLYPIIKDKKVLIYNEAYDIRLILESFEAHYGDEIPAEYLQQIEKLDTDCVMRAYADLVESPKWLKLEVAVGRKIEHRAKHDCFATGEVIRKSYKPEALAEIGATVDSDES